MKLTAAIIVACLAATATAKLSCYTNRGENLIQFNGKNQGVMFPCKYAAVKAQECGEWSVSVTPGNIWVNPKYQLDTLHIGVKRKGEGETETIWEGRMTNKQAVKYVNDPVGRSPLSTIDGKVTSSNLFSFSVERKASVVIQDKDSSFKLTFTPWDPSNRSKYPHSEWKFECFDDKEAKPNRFPQQMCGDETRNYVEEYAKLTWGLGTNFQSLALIFHTLTDTTIAQGDPKCQAATKMMTEDCSSDEQRMQVIENCNPILASKNHAACVSAHNCSPMDVFNKCVEWGCAGWGSKTEEDKEKCYNIADGIDMCANISNGGNLTARVEDANCYKDFLVINRNKRG